MRAPGIVALVIAGVVLAGGAGWAVSVPWAPWLLISVAVVVAVGAVVSAVVGRREHARRGVAPVPRDREREVLWLLTLVMLVAP